MAFASLALTTEGKSDPRQAALHRVALDCTRTLADYMLAQQEVPTPEYVLYLATHLTAICKMIDLLSHSTH